MLARGRRGNCWRTPLNGTWCSDQDDIGQTAVNRPPLPPVRARDFYRWTIPIGRFPLEDQIAQELPFTEGRSWPRRATPRSQKLAGNLSSVDAERDKLRPQHVRPLVARTTSSQSRH